MDQLSYKINNHLFIKGILTILMLILFLSICSNAATKQHRFENISNFVNKSGSTIQNRFLLPEGFKRVTVTKGSFAEYLRNLPLKPHGSVVKYYNGETKTSNTYQAVVNIDIGNKDLQQCADAIIRLRSEYLYKTKQYNSIHFKFTNGFVADYSKWMKGYRISVKWNSVKWVKTTGYSNSYSSFRKYLEMVFIYSGTLSLSKELKAKNLNTIHIGDVFIKGGSPGHCELVVDMAIHKATGERIFLLAQSFMPAQNIEILINPNRADFTPWYSNIIDDTLHTPEWSFGKSDLMGF